MGDESPLYLGCICRSSAQMPPSLFPLLAQFGYLSQFLVGYERIVENIKAPGSSRNAVMAPNNLRIISSTSLSLLFPGNYRMFILMRLAISPVKITGLRNAVVLLKAIIILLANLGCHRSLCLSHIYSAFVLSRLDQMLLRS